jgi:predicted nicotinamide N-methyase
VIEAAARPLAPEARAAFILANTARLRPPHVPEIELHLADEAHELWLRTEEELEAIGLPPPFWAFAWAGGQGLARYVLDNPHLVAGRRVLDFAAGSGLVAIAAAKAGAAHVTACDLDPFCETAVSLNARLNGVAVDTITSDLVGKNEDWEVVLAGDVFYEQALAERIMPWFRTLAEAGRTVLVGDPGRAYLPKTDLEKLATYQVPVTRALEDSEVKKTTVWSVARSA